MPLNIDQKPIILSNSRAVLDARSGTLAIFAIFSILAFIFSLVIYLQNYKTIALIKLIVEILTPWILCIFLSVYLAYKGKKHLKKLTIDDNGVFLEGYGVSVVYKWQEIRTSKILSKRKFAGGGASYVIQKIQIIRKGDILQDTYSGIIDDEFGVSILELNDVIKQGINRWGVLSGGDENLK